MTMTELEKLRHSAAHVLADAVKRLFPQAKLTIGPPIDTGFYYDFDVETPFTDEDLVKLEALMKDIIAENHPFRGEPISREDAIRYFEARNEPYKVELINSFPADQPITLHSHGQFTDLCRGGHCATTGDIKAVKLLHTAGAYWRGDSRNRMLQRIYGTAFFSTADLDAYLKQLAEAEKRDHRKLGQQLGLVGFHPWAPGSAFWLPRGTTLYHTLADWMRQLLLGPSRIGGGAGYLEVKSPLIFKKALFETSGHWQNYADDMFKVESEGEEMGIKPMNCPGHHLMYGMELRSYRDLPLRFHEQTPLHRNEVSGALSGLTRVRQFAQDDGHIYLRADQIQDEITSLLGLVARVYGALGLDYSMGLSTRNPEKFMGEIPVWDAAEKSLEAALVANKIEYRHQPNEAAFYGPKIDIQVTDALGRRWQCATIQLDYLAPERFDLEYVGEDGKKHRPVVIHRAVFGSFERFIAMLIEQYAGAFPTWLAPLQARVLVVSEKQEAFAREVDAQLRQSGIRVDLDLSNDKLGAKIRRAQLEKIPYMLVIGDKEVSSRTVSARTRDGKQLEAMDVASIAARLRAEGRPPLLDVPVDDDGANTTKEG